MTLTTNTATIDTMLEILRLDEEEVLTDSGGWADGFFRNELRIDLQELNNDNAEGAFRMVCDIHDTAGTSFREHYGIDRNCRVPDGATAQGIAELCIDIYANRELWTAGFSVEWDGSNEKAFWNDDAEGSQDAFDFWHNDMTSGFKQRVADLPCTQVYDLSDSENFRCAIWDYRDDFFPEGIDRGDKDAIQVILEERLVSNNEITFTEYTAAAEKFVEQWEEEATA